MNNAVKDSAQGLGTQFLEHQFLGGRFNDILLPVSAEPVVWPWLFLVVLLILALVFLYGRHQRKPQARMARLARSLKTGRPALRDPRAVAHELAGLIDTLPNPPGSELKVELDRLRFGPNPPRADEVLAILQQCRRAG